MVNLGKNLFVILMLLIPIISHGQNAPFIKDGKVNIATLKVDYETYEFEGGHIEHYNCSNCPKDNMPFTVNYQPPGDFGRIIFRLSPTLDTVFDGTIIWLGQGKITHPNAFNTQSPFKDTTTQVKQPNNLRYLKKGYQVMTNDSLFQSKADSAWQAIDSLAITNRFRTEGFRAGAYLYTPAVGAFDPGPAKWIIFLYNQNSTSLSTDYHNKQREIALYPNPTNGQLFIETSRHPLSIKNYKVIDHSGATVANGRFQGKQHRLNLDFLSPGQYFIEVSGPKGQVLQTNKVIIH